MWLHTTLNYQYKHGTGLRATVTTLWREGGAPRLYRGIGFALLLSPAMRFCDVAANAGCLEALEGCGPTRELPLAAKTAVGSVVASTARLALLPLDNAKTIMQVRLCGRRCHSLQECCRLDTSESALYEA